MKHNLSDGTDNDSEILRQIEESLNSLENRRFQKTCGKISQSEIRNKKIYLKLLISETNQIISVENNEISNLVNSEGKSTLVGKNNIELGEEPKFLLFLAALAYGPEKRDEIRDFMSERYRKDVKCYGRTRAKALLARDITVSYLPFIRAIFRNGVIRVGKAIGIFQVIKKYFFG